VRRYVVDASVAIKWFVPEIHSDAALRTRYGGSHLHVPAFMILELGNVLAKKIRQDELAPKDGDTILKELKRLPLQRHADERLFAAAYRLALDTRSSLYDCLYLALAEVVDGIMVTADRKFVAALTEGPYRRRVMWVEDIPPVT
jgi:predicted nucleic acid-binding protein